MKKTQAVLAATLLIPSALFAAEPFRIQPADLETIPQAARDARFRVQPVSRNSTPYAARDARYRVQPEPDFERDVREGLRAFQAKDAFQEVQACWIADAMPLRPFTLEQAVRLLEPCAEGLSSLYQVPVSVRQGLAASGGDFSVQLQGIVFTIKSAPLGSAALRDLSRGLNLRRGRLLGHPAVARREEQKPRSAAQEAVDRCVLPAVLRKIESGSDFLRTYGRCIREDSSLKVREIRPSETDPMAVTLLSSADRPTIESLNGYVAVESEKGLVEILVLAYPEVVFLP